MAVVGKILLGILILLLALILLVLFYPICYRVYGKKDSEGFACKIRVHWLLGLLRVFYDLPKPGKPVIKIAFFTLGSSRKKPSKNKSSKPSVSAEPSEKKDDVKSPEDMESEGHPKDADDKKASEIKDEKGNSEDTTGNGDSEAKDQKADSEAKDSKEAPEEHDGEDAAGSGNDPKRSKKKSRGRFDPEKLKNDFEFYKELWEDENTKPFLKDALARIFHLLRNLLPRKITGRIIFGAASPDVTGYVFGIHCALRAIYPKKLLLELTPDFENSVLEADFSVKGHFTIFIVVYDALRLWFDKRLKRIRKKLDAHKSKAKEKEE